MALGRAPPGGPRMRLHTQRRLWAQAQGSERHPRDTPTRQACAGHWARLGQGSEVGCTRGPSQRTPITTEAPEAPSLTLECAAKGGRSF